MDIPAEIKAQLAELRAVHSELEGASDERYWR